MEKDNKKKHSPDIDEELMMNLMVEGIKKEGLKAPEDLTVKKNQISVELKAEVQNDTLQERIKKTRKRNETDYENIFFQKSETQARDGKAVYIRPDFHEKLTRIVQVIGEDKISIYAYLDNVLDFHFRQFGNAITQSFNEKYKPIL